MNNESLPRRRSLSRLVRDGIQLHPIPPVQPGDPAGGRLGRGALQAAWLALYPKARGPGDNPTALYVSGDLASDYPELREDMGPGCPWGPTGSCPAPTEPGRSLEQKIIHLEDRHWLTRERVADWLETHGH